MQSTSRRAVALLVAAVVALAAAATFAVIESRHASHASSLSHERTNVTALAGQYAVDFTSIDYRHMQDQAKAEAKNATSAFGNVYTATIQTFGTYYTKHQIVETTSVQRAALSSLNSTTAVALVALRGVTTTSTNKTGSPQLLRILITMTKVNGHWLTSNLAPQ